MFSTCGTPNSPRRASNSGVPAAALNIKQLPKLAPFKVTRCDRPSRGCVGACALRAVLRAGVRDAMRCTTAARMVEAVNGGVGIACPSRRIVAALLEWFAPIDYVDAVSSAMRCCEYLARHSA